MACGDALRVYVIVSSKGGARSLARKIVVQQSRTRDFPVRTHVPVRMSERASRMGKQYESSGTSWYELVRAGTEVTNRREPRENRRTSRAQSIY
jgi:precorrin-2 methylase